MRAVGKCATKFETSINLIIDNFVKIAEFYSQEMPSVLLTIRPIVHATPEIALFTVFQDIIFKLHFFQITIFSPDLRSSGLGLNLMNQSLYLWGELYLQRTIPGVLFVR
jgi:hypothetical protein